MSVEKCVLEFVKLCGIFWIGVQPAIAEVNVLAAASLGAALSEVAHAYQLSKKASVGISLGSSPALAKQIEHGAPADIFISADRRWMDYLESKHLIDSSTRRDFLRNALILVAPKGKGFPVFLDKDFDLSTAFKGHLCTGATDAVPLGVYAKETLLHLGWWEGIKSRLVGADSAQAALNLVERGECDVGILYETDLHSTTKIDIIGRFPEETHSPIVYPIARVTASTSKETQPFLEYLQQGNALTIFAKYGFKPITRP